MVEFSGSVRGFFYFHSFSNPRSLSFEFYVSSRVINPVQGRHFQFSKSVAFSATPMKWRPFLLLMRRRSKFVFLAFY